MLTTKNEILSIFGSPNEATRKYLLDLGFHIDLAPKNPEMSEKEKKA